MFGGELCGMERKIAGLPQQQVACAEEIKLVKRLSAQQKQDKNKLYSLHAPEVECIGKSRFASIVGTAWQPAINCR